MSTALSAEVGSASRRCPLSPEQQRMVDLCEEAKDNIDDEDALHRIFADMRMEARVMDDRDARAKELARAVVAFAEWHTSGYEGDRSKDTFDTVSGSLWEDVRCKVQYLIKESPKNPALVQEILPFTEARRTG